MEAAPVMTLTLAAALLYVLFEAKPSGDGSAGCGCIVLVLLTLALCGIIQ